MMGKTNGWVLQMGIAWHDGFTCFSANQQNTIQIRQLIRHGQAAPLDISTSVGDLSFRERPSCSFQPEDRFSLSQILPYS